MKYKAITKPIFALIGLVMVAFTAQAQPTPPTGTPYITMTVTNNAAVKINMQAADEDTVWIETAAGSYTPVTVGTSWTGWKDYTATGITIKVHGNLKGFSCSSNYTKLTGLTFSSGLTNLEELYCFANSLKTLNVSELTNLKTLWCYINSLLTLNVSGLTNLTELDCSRNFLTSLDVSRLTNLTKLSCYNNSLATLNVSGLTNLETLSCSNNSLTSLDVSGLTGLKTLYCYNNNFSTQAIDDIYCGLPEREISDNAVIYPVLNSSSADTAVVFATNKQNAITKNWKVQYYSNNTNIPATSGNWTCSPATPPTDTPYITMTVTNNDSVSINMQAAADNTTVWVETSTGSYTPVTVGTSWTGSVNYTASGTTIKVHGNLKGFDCRGNYSKLTGLTFSEGLTNLEFLVCYYNKLTSLDVSGLTGLKTLYCYNNKFSTQAIDDIYCGLPAREISDNARIYPIYSSTSADTTIVMGTNKQNAIGKKWKVQDANNTDIPATTGNYVCNLSTDVDNITATRQISIYPNPAKEMVTVKLCQSHIGMLYITDMSGKVVLSKQMENAIVSVDISTLAQGVYFVKAGSEVEKLIVK